MVVQIRGIIHCDESPNVNRHYDGGTKRITISYRNMVLEMGIEQTIRLIRDLRRDLLGTDYIALGKYSIKHCKNCKHVDVELCKKWWFEIIYRGKEGVPGTIDTCDFFESKLKETKKKRKKG